MYDRRHGQRRNGERRKRTGVRVWMIVVVLLLGLGIFFGASYISATREQDLIAIACGNAIGHRELTIAVADNARLTNDIAEELGLPVEPIEIQIPPVPPECES